MAEITLQQPAALIFLPLLWLALLLFAWRRRFKPFGAFLLRLLMLVFITLALSRPVFTPPAAASAEEVPQRRILLVDQSASLGTAGQAALQAEAERLAQESPGLTELVYFAQRPVVTPSLSPSSEEGVGGRLNPNLTNLAEALRTGVKLLNGQPGRLVLLSDGQANEGDTPQALREAAQAGVPIDALRVDESTLQEWRGGPNEVRLVKLSVPPVLRQGETFVIEATIHSLSPTQATLRLTQAEMTLAEDVVSLEAGSNIFTYEAEAGTLGPQIIEAAVAAPENEDNETANNRLAAFAQVYPPPQILVVSAERGSAGRFIMQLRRAGFSIERLSPAELPTRLSELEPYAGMVLADVSARDLTLEQMIAVQEFVRSLGRGLLATAGRNSFSLGSYEDTPLADLLPVMLEPPPRAERPPVALLLMIDHSGSMLERSTPVTKLAMAKEAAIRATNILGPQDLIGVLMFDNAYEWVIPFQQVSDGAALLDIQQRIAQIPGGGGTRILQALQIGLPALAEQETADNARHAVLLTDGKSFDGVEGPQAYDEVVDAAQKANITLSTIAIGEEADQELLTHLAERGHGRYHFAPIPEELPELTIAESDILRSNAIQEGEFQPTVFAPHPMLRGLLSAPANAAQDQVEELPTLSGYLAQTPKSRAEIALQIGPGDPLLSVWGYGLGRVAAWTSETGGEWAGTWEEWSAASRFWGQVVGYTLPEPGLGLLQLQAEVSPDGVATLTAEALTASDQPVDLARTEAILTTPGGREIPLTLRQTAPGRYQQRLRLPDPGVYQLTATQNRADEAEQTATIGFAAPYSVEFALPAEGTGEPLLQQIAEASGGRRFALDEALQVEGCALQVEGCKPQDNPTPTGTTSQPLNLQYPEGIISLISNFQSLISNLQSPIELWPWLLAAALILWPIEIAWRRWGRLRIQ
ncbi:MAG: VWA domain-containing protein [Anaerolineae bacterium]